MDLADGEQGLFTPHVWHDGQFSTEVQNGWSWEKSTVSVHIPAVCPPSPRLTWNRASWRGREGRVLLSLPKAPPSQPTLGMSQRAWQQLMQLLSRLGFFLATPFSPWSVIWGRHRSSLGFTWPIPLPQTSEEKQGKGLETKASLWLVKY